MTAEQECDNFLEVATFRVEMLSGLLKKFLRESLGQSAHIQALEEALRGIASGDYDATWCTLKARAALSPAPATTETK